MKTPMPKTHARSANSPFTLMKITTELIKRLTMASPAKRPGALPHSAISTLMNNNKNIEFKNKTPTFILKLLTIKLKNCGFVYGDTYVEKGMTPVST